jgi:membrane-associated protease RseP (regulator of RpoE activity)
MSILLAIAILALLVLVHESGHFLAARLQGIHVSQFSLGFGPALWSYMGKTTEYAVRLFPLGGYVGFPDDDPVSPIPANDPNLLKNRGLGDRAIVISAGVFANFVFAYLVLLLMVITVGVGVVDQPGVRVAKVLDPTSPAAIAGLQVNDVILRADKVNIGNDLDNLEQFQKLISQTGQKSINLGIERGGQNLELTITPNGEVGSAKIGVGLDWNGKPHRQPIRNLPKAIARAAQDFERIVVMTWQGLAQLVTNFQATANKVSGPVAIVATGANLVKSDRASLFDFTAIISINLAIINLLPLPALDGGQLFFLLIELLRGGKPLPAKLQENVMQGGLVVILGLGLFMIARDSLNLIHQSGFLPL